MVDVNAQALYSDGTVVRIRGEIAANLEPIAAVSQITLGMIVVTRDAFDAGVAAIPSPAIDTGADWIWWGTMHFQNNTAFNTAEKLVRLEVNNKAMRKLPGVNKALVLVIQNQIALTNYLVSFNLRTLVKLH